MGIAAEVASVICFYSIALGCEIAVNRAAYWPSSGNMSCHSRKFYGVSPRVIEGALREGYSPSPPCVIVREQ